MAPRCRTGRTAFIAKNLPTCSSLGSCGFLINRCMIVNPLKEAGTEILNPSQALGVCGQNLTLLPWLPQTCISRGLRHSGDGLELVCAGFQGEFRLRLCS